MVMTQTIMAEVAALLIHMERKAVGSMNPSMRKAGRVPWVEEKAINYIKHGDVPQ